eukprot:CAMPEP_0183378408 /NCGR_PEP_ID=MMETSP0164_2-20130417/124899_1 /TAXON_ID=221442 /ORGANISM="Coccolithus pelagicus ssp braarudi, Strain PLY182g" /LENGTH=141 /DNA_ID=CAMNT_0025555965 /DNA_START=838 /DNA_END=1263 /DNA_ORIENTATION=-
MAESGEPEYPKALKQVLQHVGVQALKRAQGFHSHRPHQGVGVGGTLMDQTNRNKTLDPARYPKMAGSDMPARPKALKQGLQHLGLQHHINHCQHKPQASAEPGGGKGGPGGAPCVHPPSAESGAAQHPTLQEACALEEQEH